MIRADVIGPVQDTVRRPMIHVESGPSKGEELGLPGSVGENESKASVTKGSRYYVRRRIIIGNAAKSLLTKAGVLRTDEYNQEEAVAEGNLPTHKWRIYIKSPKSQPDPSYNHLSFIRAVRFFLHPSYRPNDIVDVTEPPFELIRSGWGEFPIRIQIHFWDPRNRPVELVHLVRVLTATTGKYTTLAEQAHDLDLDRRTDFKSRGSMVTLPELESRAAKVSDDDVLSMAIGDFPLAGKKGKRATSCPVKYRPASSMEEFLRMDIIQQKQIEQQRAASLCSHLMSAFPTFTKNTGKVVSWCREKGYTPASVASLVTALDDSNVSPEDLLYCRFCGLAHLPQDKFDILQKNCSLRPRKIHVTSKTSSADLLGRFELLPENNDVVKRLKQECFGSTFMPYCQAEVSPVRKCDYEEGEDDAQSQREEWTRQKIQELHLSHFHSKNIGTVRVMNCAMQVLLRKLVDTSLREIPDSKERRANTPVLLTPLHLYRAILNQPELDFLTNAHMLGGALPKDGPSPPTL